MCDELFLGWPLGPDGTAEDFGGMSFNNSSVLKTLETKRFTIVKSPSCLSCEQDTISGRLDRSEVARTSTQVQNSRRWQRQAQSIQELNKFRAAESILE